MLLNSLLRKIGVGVFLFTLTGTSAYAWCLNPETGHETPGNCAQPATPQYHEPPQIAYPPYGGGNNSIGGCNAAGTFCWNITLPPTPPSGPYYTYPIEVYGEEAKNIVERGHIIDRRFSWSGWRYLVKTGWQSWFQFKNKTFDCSVSRHQPTEYYCEEWTPQDRW